jgi:hypothetical protein
MNNLSDYPIPVDIYRNLNNGKLSIKSRRTKDYGIVIGYADTVCLKTLNL